MLPEKAPNAVVYDVDVWSDDLDSWVVNSGFILSLADLENNPDLPFTELFRHVRGRTPRVAAIVEGVDDQDNVVRVRWRSSAKRKPLFFRYRLVERRYMPEAEELEGALEIIDLNAAGKVG